MLNQFIKREAKVNKNSKIVEEVRADYQARRNARLSLEMQWQLNINFMMGNQYSYIANNGAIR